MAKRTFILPRLLSRDHAILNIVRTLEELPLDQGYRIEIHEHKATRSLAQNAYLHGVCYKLLGDAIGYEMEEVSEYCCGTYFGWREKKVPKKPSNPEGIESVPIRTTTTDAEGHRSVLGKTAFAEYIGFLQRFGASKGIYIPDPDPDYAVNLEEEAEA